MKKILIITVSFFLLLIFFSYKLTKVPAGMTIDEGAFGLNAVLISETLRDENGRLLPVFVLSIDGKDWRQPVTQYFITFLFKATGPSIYNLKLTSAIIASISVLLIFILGKKLFGLRGAFIASLFLATTPIFMIHSHLALDNIYPIPFTILWLLFLYLYKEKKNLLFLFFSAVSLGIGFYSYKAMRVFVPTWSVLSVLFLSKDFLIKRTKKEFKKIVGPAFLFGISISFFYAIIPILEYKYAGAVLDNTQFKWEGFYKLIYPYLTSFDISFLFVKGDEFLHHSTGIHGMLLLFSLPFFIIGLIASYKKDSFSKFLIASLFLGPLLFSIVGSVHRASRLMALIPIYSLICTYGAIWLIKMKRKLIFSIFTVLFLINYLSFIKYYWGDYATDTQHIFYKTELDAAYSLLKKQSEERNFTPFVEDSIVAGEVATDEFIRSMYFLYPPAVWYANKADFPENAILLSRNSKITELKRIEETKNYYLYIKE